MKILKNVVFALFYVVIVVMGVATFVGHSRGEAFAATAFYGSWWFALLWVVIAVGGGVVLFRHRRRLPMAMLHTSFLIILVGALTTSLTARHGMVHLRQGEPVRQMMLEGKDGNMSPVSLPFIITLDHFAVDYHAGTTSPADYRSEFHIKTADGRIVKGATSMNRIFSYDGMRFYQSSYDKDSRGSYLSVNADRWGITLTYIGYALLFISFIWLIIDPKGGFRALLRSSRLRTLNRSFCIIALFFAASTVGVKAAPVLPADVADRFGRLMVDYNGRVCPVQTLAVDFTKKLHGSASYDGYSAEQVLTGFLFYAHDWRNEPIFKVKSGELRAALGLDKYAAVNDFFNPAEGYRLGPYLQAYYDGDHSAVNKAAADMDDRLMLVVDLRNGGWMKMFPVTTPVGLRWATPFDTLPGRLPVAQRRFVQDVFNNFYRAQINEGNNIESLKVLQSIADYQQRYGAASMPSPTQVKAERIYNTWQLSVILSRVNLTIGLILVVLLIRRLLRTSPGPRRRWERIVPPVLAALSFVLLTTEMALRTIVTGRLPLGNGYETMLAVAWCVLLCTLLLSRRLPVVAPFGFLSSGFFLLVSSISQMDPQITPLMPVLSSPLLSVHVSVIMLAYALLSFTFLCAVTALVIVAVRGRRDPAAAEKVATLDVISRLFLYPAVALLGIGIFIGAVWANQSWGRYWGWDPKETWALISFMVYAAAFHVGSLPFMRRPVIYHVYMVLAFLTVLMTYAGVNYFLGGMHSYAG